MPPDPTPNNDELTATLPENGFGAANEAVPPAPKRPPAEPRAFESLHDNDPAHAAGNADDNTQAS